MYFNNKKDLICFLKTKNYLGCGSQGTCFLDLNTNIVYKVFNQFLDEDYDEDEYIEYSKDDIMRYSHLVNNTFIFPKDVIIVNDVVVGYITDFVKAIHLNCVSNLCINLDNFSKGIEIANKDIKFLSDNNITLFDVVYNLLYDEVNDRFYVTDCDEFGRGLDDLNYDEYNFKNFNSEIYWFLIDGYFNEFIKGHKDLNKMYNDKDEDLLYFLKLFRKYLSEYLDKDIKYLYQDEKVRNKKKHEPIYMRHV